MAHAKVTMAMGLAALMGVSNLGAPGAAQKRATNANSHPAYEKIHRGAIRAILPMKKYIPVPPGPTGMRCI